MSKQLFSRSLRRQSWHSLQEFATKDTDAIAFRSARALAADVSTTTEAQKAAAASSTTATSASSIDWSKYESSISDQHQDLVKLLKQHHDTQIASLNTLLKQDHSKEISQQNQATQPAFDSTFNDMISISNKSVENSEEIVANGAKALYISSNNPSIGEVGTSEWLETDQYWSAFVEKHHYYHNHLDCTTEDPESTEYQSKIESDLRGNLKKIDDLHPVHNGMSYQKGSYDYYNFYKCELVCHMIHYLVKTGGSARFFPELPIGGVGGSGIGFMNENYDYRWRLINVLQSRRRKFQEESLDRVLNHEYMPTDLVHGEGYYAKLIGQQNLIVENCVGRLMSCYGFLSDGICVQTYGGYINVVNSGVKGKWYSLGDDVNAVFFKADADSGSNSNNDTSSISPLEAWNSYLDHLTLSGGTKLHPVLSEAGTIFSEVLEQRKLRAGPDQSWFNLPNESTADAFLRRLNKQDPCYSVYKEYVEELKEKWASDNCTVITVTDVETRIKSIIEPQYYKDLEVYEREVLFNGSENPQAKQDMDMVLKLDDDSSGIYGVGYDGKVLSGSEIKGKCVV